MKFNQENLKNLYNCLYMYLKYLMFTKKKKSHQNQIQKHFSQLNQIYYLFIMYLEKVN